MGRFGCSAGLVAGLLTILPNAEILFAVAAVWLRSGCCWHARYNRPLCKWLACQAPAGKGRPCCASVMQNDAIKDARRDELRGPCSPVDLICPGPVTVGMCVPTKSIRRIKQGNARTSTNATSHQDLDGLCLLLTICSQCQMNAAVACMVTRISQKMNRPETSNTGS